ncbi:hypothetical protein UFOVP97_51 [uncultured Caudovirales phage]|uniref:Uncharacterized protein n=1 Tax=uncultured Caudovirales phage TaxID=2100421 RepID=A0A6J5L3L0_9CAUD|nr:hypothetical protein UFOVP97_51 [uncultured Caudovirales phage]CAB4134074.1 hypothetical protein UFOVP268_13 [uncultured Caudovirales phage]
MKKMNAEMQRDFDPVFTNVTNKYSSEYHDFLNSVNAVSRPYPANAPNPDDMKFDKAARKRYNKANDFHDWEFNDANYR